MFDIIGKRKIWYLVSSVLFLGSVVGTWIWGLNFGIDFTGGSLLEVRFDQRPADSEISSKLDELNLGDLQIQPTGDRGVIIKSKFLSPEEKNSIFEKLKSWGEVEELSYESIGPAIGQELRERALIGALLVMLGIIIYVWYAFRKISDGPVPSWLYGVGAIIALVHDVCLVIGLFAVLGHFWRVELDAMFVTAILTVLGYSVNDTIVVYDRIRENLKRNSAGTFEKLINQSINQTLTRSLNTGACALFTLFTLFLFGGDKIHYFVLTLIAGIVFGTYSSIFIASPLLLLFQKVARR